MSPITQYVNYNFDSISSLNNMFISPSPPIVYQDHRTPTLDLEYA